ncbi:hypothetical protein THRCLA_03327 [Thraustotheca clavata]|uniref:Chromatin assembly factor 1 subunit A dimerization domain-containing protein n=1 Tax=Thraustotheca clavata TaxID=74557 RepID=A0A1W0A2E9_9STRA|nr:hypothetical protein THRCLA_03327 [Thraustotheca clavata]
MTTPEKKQQSIAAFFSPIARAKVASEALSSAKHSPVKESSVDTSKQEPATAPAPLNQAPAPVDTQEKVVASEKGKSYVTPATLEIHVPFVKLRRPKARTGLTPLGDEVSCGTLHDPIDIESDKEPSKKRANESDEDYEAPPAKVQKKEVKAQASTPTETAPAKKRTRPIRQASLPKEVKEVVEIDLVSPRKPTPRVAKKTPEKPPEVVVPPEPVALPRKPAPRAAKKIPEKPPVVEAPPEPVAVLSPAQQQKLELYQTKLCEIEATIAGLLPPSTELISQEIYGITLDHKLELGGDFEKECQDALVSSTSSSVLPPALKIYLGRFVQGRLAALSVLVTEICTNWKNWAPDHTLSAALIEMEIKMLAERISYGSKPKKFHPFEDLTPRALFVWEVGNLESCFSSDESIKTIRRMRKQRKRTGLYLKTLDRIALMLHDVNVDDSKVSVEEVKVGKFLLTVEQEKQRATEKEHKATLQMEKEENKRREKEEAAEKKRLKQISIEKEREEQEASKRRQSLVSYFQPAPTSKSATAVSAVPASNPSVAIDLTAQNTMEDIDRALGCGGHDKLPLSRRALASLVAQKAKRPLTTGVWSSRRIRHPGLGIKKLFQFHENYRPAYWGTFSKKTRALRGGRRPLAFVPSLDYSIDSDDEWEEEEVGESLSDKDSDEEPEDGEDALDYGDKWLAYEDEVDYIDNLNEGEEGIETQTSRHLKVTDVPKAFKLTKLIPRVCGPFYTSQTEALVSFRIEVLNPIVLESPLLKKASEVKKQSEVLSPVKAPTPATKSTPAPGLSTWLKPQDT